MPTSTQPTSPIVRISYECVLRERGREANAYLYEIACSITYAVASGHLSLRITGQNTYRNVAAREVTFTQHAKGATTYIELLEAEQLEVRIIELEGSYCKAFYYAHRQELSELNGRGIVSTIQRIGARAEAEANGKLS